MKLENVNKEWALEVTFDRFCKDTNISKLSFTEQCQLYEAVTGKQPKIKKGKEGEV
jgi:hypothetical protein